MHWNWQDSIEAFSVGAFPWISEIKKLNFHFHRDSIDISKVYNLFASIFSISIFIYCNNDGVEKISTFPQWWIFLIFAFVGIVLYLAIFLKYEEAVKRNEKNGVIIINFIIYILFFCLLTFGFGILNLYKYYYVVDVAVYDSRNNPKKAEVYINFTDYPEHFITDTNGKWRLPLDKSLVSQDSKLDVISETENFEESFSNTNTLLKQLSDIKLRAVK